jgi:thioredoxin-related protein
MRKGSLTGLLLLLIFAVSAVLLVSCGEKAEKTVAPQEKIAFITNYDSALALAKEKNQNILIDFYTDWCTWCKTLDTITYVDSSVIAFSKNIVFAKINAEVDTAVAQKYKIMGYPTIILARADGTEIDRIGGYLPPAEFLETVDNYLHDRETLADYLRRADTSSTIEVNYVLANKYSDRGMNDKAIEYFNKVIMADPKAEDSLTPDAMLSLGYMYLRNDDYKKSFDQFKKVMKAFDGEETGADAMLYLAYGYRARGEKGDTASAIKLYEDFLKKYPESPDTAHAMSMIEKLKNPPPPKEEGK